MIKLIVIGACGRMGSRIIALANQDKQLKVVLGMEKKGHQMAGKAMQGIRISDSPEEIETGDVLVEFTNAEATIEHLDWALKYKKPMVIGTTGLSDEQKEKIKKASQKIPVLFSPNMSIAVNLLFKLVKDVSQILKDYNVNIIEAHHIHKKDVPSGTAKKLAEIIKEVQGKEVKDIKSIREDEIVGDHEIIFDSDLDRVKLFHSAKSRDIFVQGVLKAAKWIFNKPAGFYSMSDLLLKE